MAGDRKIGRESFFFFSLVVEVSISLSPFSLAPCTQTTLTFSIGGCRRNIVSFVSTTFHRWLSESLSFVVVVCGKETFFFHPPRKKKKV